MTTSVHKNLTGSDLHEPKGADTALTGCVYVSDGAGSGSWISASSIITNQAFSTGDAKLTYKTTADTGWVIFNDGTIGDASSGASTRANADTSALFTLLYGLAVGLTVSGGRGANAASDFAAHKTITLPKTLGRALAIYGAGSGLTSRNLGDIIGAETVTIAQSGLPNVVLTFTGSSVNATGAPYIAYNASYAGGVIINNGGSGVVFGSSPSNVTPSITAAGAISSLNGNTTQTTTSIMQPSAFINVMVKL